MNATHDAGAPSARPHVVIIGCGFAGLAAANTLAGKAVDVTLVDRVNHHLFQPLLYQVATAGLAAPAIAAPIRHLLRRARNVTTLLAEVRGIDVARRVVRLDDGGVLRYDQLIVAASATHSDFGRDEWAPFAPGLKTLDDALEIRRRILLAFERAERESCPQRRRAWLTFAVVGAGPTGAELAGTLAEIARRTLRDEFRRIAPGEARIVLIEGGDGVLPTYPAELSARARSQLQRLGVDVRTSCRVTGIDAAGVSIGATRVPARTVLWAAGVAASALGRDLADLRDAAGRVAVQPDLSIDGHPRCSSPATWRHCARRDTACRPTRRPRNRWDDAPRSTCCAGSAGGPRSRFAIATTARSQPSAAAPRLRRWAASSCGADRRGCCGCSRTSPS
jgi:NADH dehydrogenase